MIRKATLEDVEVIVSMVGHFINDATLGYGRVLKFVPKTVAKLAREIIVKGVLLVAEKDGKVIGMIGGLPLREPISDSTMLDELVWWVEPAHRSGTVGPKLLRCFENWARQNGLEACKMIAPVRSDVGRYYERTGYVPIETSYVKRLR